MPGTVIGTSMNLGFPGNYSRNGDCIIEPKQVTPADATGPNFGDPVVLIQNSTGGTYSGIAQAIAASVTPVMTQGTNGCFAGVAVREVLTMTAYIPSPTLGSYLPGQAADVLVRGSVSVQIQNPSSAAVKAGGSVWVRLSAGTGTVIGAWEPANDAGHMLQITNAFFTTGLVDANSTSEITLLNRNIP